MTFHASCFGTSRNQSSKNKKVHKENHTESSPILEGTKMTFFGTGGWGMAFIKTIQFLWYVIMVQSVVKARGDRFEEHPEELCRIILVSIMYGLICLRSPGTGENIAMCSIQVVLVKKIFDGARMETAVHASTIMWTMSFLFGLFQYLSTFLFASRPLPTIRMPSGT